MTGVQTCALPISDKSLSSSHLPFIKGLPKTGAGFFHILIIIDDPDACFKKGGPKKSFSAEKRRFGPRLLHYKRPFLFLCKREESGTCIFWTGRAILILISNKTKLFLFFAILAKNTSHKNPTRLSRYKKLLKLFNRFWYKAGSAGIFSGYAKNMKKLKKVITKYLQIDFLVL